ncbi:alpha/beta hydrolase [Piscibacillus salipiscarius]|uniref:Alpha/beta hydrolase n=1 Tax=Piscibacillus salipiscarius TaxID=299480 RepID=A0ABW5QBI1_9BACI|nr:alpha/beta hydrolase [Piscibacillus salipiscarius]
MLKKKWVKVGIGLLVLLMLIDIFASFYFYDLAIKREKKDFLQNNDDLVVSREAMDVFVSGGWREWVDNQNFEYWELQSFDDLRLQGYYLEAEEPTNKTVVFAHGYLGRARDMGLYGEYYYEELGYNMLSVDLRGHGQSQGDYIGFGWHSRLDLVDWVNKLVEKQGEDTEIILHGLSMGAASVLMASGEDMPSNVNAIVADSPYTSVYDLFDYQMGRMFNLPSFPILDSTSLVTKAKADYSLKEASALKQVKKAEVPILYIHGNSDDFVPTRMTKELYKHTNSEAQIKVFENSSHGEAFAIYRDEYIETLEQFLKKYME